MRSDPALPSLLLLATTDDYLLELARGDHEEEWKALNPGGEIVTFDEPPAPDRLLRELTSPSLFAPARLLVVRDAAWYFAKEGLADGQAIAGELAHLSLRDASLLLAVLLPKAQRRTAKEELQPGGPLAEVARERGELRTMPLPPEPKPWEESRLTDDQRAELRRLVTRVAPEVAKADEAVEVLFELYGFRPRELAQAAQRVVLTGEITPTSVRRVAGLGWLSLRTIEDALIDRDAKAYLRFSSALGAGAVLEGWRGEAVGREAYGAILVATLGRLLRHALAMRGYARRAGVADQLKPAVCAASRWYTDVFRKRLHKPLTDVIAGRVASPFATASPWQLHRAFRLAAAYDEPELLAAIAALARSGAERSTPEMALAAVNAVVLDLLAPSAPTRARKAAVG